MLKKGERLFKQAIFAVACLQPRQFVSLQIRFMVLIIAKTQQCWPPRPIQLLVESEHTKLTSSRFLSRALLRR